MIQIQFLKYLLQLKVDYKGQRVQMKKKMNNKRMYLRQNNLILLKLVIKVIYKRQKIKRDRKNKIKIHRNLANLDKKNRMKMPPIKMRKIKKNKIRKNQQNK